jgi:hypothetical protein
LSYYFGQLVDIARLDLVAVVLEPAIPVLGHLRTLVLKHAEHLLDRLLVDHAAQTGQRGILGRDHHGHVVVQDLDCQVLALVTEYVLHFLAEHLAGAVVGIDDVVADLELDVGERLGGLKILQVLFH